MRYDPGTRAVQRVEFDGLPRARGGQNAASVELIGRNELGADFFRHARHHEPNRRAIEGD